jgi:hypothetical protein
VQESNLLGTILPSSPDFVPIINELRGKYGLREVLPNDDPIEEVFLDGEVVSLEDFRQEIRALVEGAPDLMPAPQDKMLTHPAILSANPS